MVVMMMIAMVRELPVWVQVVLGSVGLYVLYAVLERLLLPVLAPRRVPGSPFPLGNVSAMLPDRLLPALWDATSGKYGPVAEMRSLFGRRIFVYGDKDSITRMLTARPATYRRASLFEGWAEAVGVKDLGLFNAEGEVWKKTRRFYQPSLNAKSVSNMVDPIAVEAMRFVEHLQTETGLDKQTEKNPDAAAFRRPSDNKPSPQPDFRTDCQRYTAGVLGRVLFGNALSEEEYLRHGHLLADVAGLVTGITRRTLVPLPEWIWGLWQDNVEKNFQASMARFNRFVSTVITGDQADDAGIAAENVPAGTMLRLMLDAMEQDAAGGDETGKGGLSKRNALDAAAIGANLRTTLIAAVDTTSATLGWVMYYLAKDPALAARVREEGDAVLGADRVARPAPTTSEEYDRLRVSHAVALECLRCQSPAPILFLEPVNNNTPGPHGVTLHKGDTLLLNLDRLNFSKIYADDKHAENEMEFDPDRWLRCEDEAGLQQMHQMLHAFGGGARVCPGNRLAIMELVVAATTVARHLDLALAPGHDVRREMAFVTRADSLPLVVTPRQDGDN